MRGDTSTRHDRYWQAMGTNERRWAQMDRRNERRRVQMDQLRSWLVARLVEAGAAVQEGPCEERLNWARSVCIDVRG